MSTIAAVEETGDEKPSDESASSLQPEQAEQQETQKTERHRKQRKPDIQRYRPPGAKGEPVKRRGSGDETVPKIPEDNQNKLHSTGEREWKDHRHGFKSGPNTTAGGGRRHERTPVSARFLRSGTAGTGDGGNRIVESSGNSRATNQFRNPISSDFHQGQRGPERPQRSTFDEGTIERHFPSYQQRGTRDYRGSQESITPRSRKTSGSESNYGGGKKNRQFIRTGSNNTSNEEWKTFAQGYIRKPNQKNSDVAMERQSHSQSDAAAVSSSLPSASQFHSLNVIPDDSRAKSESPTAPISVPESFAWAEEMEQEDKKRREMQPDQENANISMAGAASRMPGPSTVTSLQLGGERGGIIPMTACLANAMKQGERRNAKGRGVNPRGRSYPPRGRGSAAGFSSGYSPGGLRGFVDRSSNFVFPQGRMVGESSSGCIRISGPGGLPDVVPNAVSMRRAPISAMSLPPGYEDRDTSKASLLRPDVNNEMEELERVVAALCDEIGRGGRGWKNRMKEMMPARQKLQGLFGAAVFIDPRHEEQRNLDHRMWKSAFYQPVEAFRSALRSNMPTADVELCRSTLLSLIEEGIQFYLKLVEDHESNYGYTVDKHCYQTDHKPANEILKYVLTPAPSPTSSVKYSLACCQRYFVSLGDLARYKELVKGTQQFGQARKYYTKAAQLAPANGRAHNQLALLAVYTSRWLDAVFYYVRSLGAKHAFATARESLSTLLEDIRKKVDLYETARKKELTQMRKEQSEGTSGTSAKRMNEREIWKFPDGTTSDMKCNAEKEELDEVAVLTKYSPQELHKRCCAYVLHAAGILFSRIGMENFETIAEAALIQFRALLNLDESPLTSGQLVQLTVILLFLIHHTSDVVMERGSIKAVQNYAILLSFSVFGLLLERLEQLLRTESILETFNKQMHVLLPSIRIFCTWMTSSMYDVYSGAQSGGGALETEKFTVSMWKNLATVCTMIERYKNSGKLKVVDSKCVPTARLTAVLSEDLFTTSFFDVWLLSKPNACELSKEVEPELAAEHVRLNSLLDLASVLDGSDFEAFTIENGQYVVRSRPDSPQLGQPRAVASDEEDTESGNHEAGTSEVEPVAEMSQLQLLQKDNEMKQSAFEREGMVRKVIIVEPHHLVVDTNSFIDHCGLIKKVIQAKQYKVTIPLVVYNELRGLEKSDDSWLSQQAKTSWRMLDEFKKPGSSFSKYVEPVTSAGCVVPDFEYYKNEEAQRLKNDDLILKCCQTLIRQKENECQLKSESRDLKFEPLQVHRKVVLVTDDKNLRLKAVGAEIPVMGIVQLVKLARLDPH